MALPNTTSTPPATASSNQPFPFMKLPPELRLQIYKIAIEDANKTFCLTFDFSEERRIRPKHCGALGFLHTSKEIRAESAKEMVRVAVSQHWRWRNRRCFIQKAEQNSLTSLRPALREKLMRAVTIELMVKDMEMALFRCVSPSSAFVVEWFGAVV